MKVYVVFDASVDDNPIVDAVKQEDFAQYKQRKMDELEKRIRDDNESVLSMERQENHYEQFGGDFGVEAIISEKGYPDMIIREFMGYRPMTIWEP